MELPKAYEAQSVEASISKQWRASGYTNPDKLPGRRKETFSIAMPPPNATGILHIGHTVMIALQDILTRFERMRGKKSLWLPGTDHAAIATQNVVEQELKKEGTTKRNLGRTAFVKRVEEFVASKQGVIREQIERMGASCDWSRERFTLDEGLSNAVTEAFVTMYKDGLIYRGTRVVNWCPHCQSTLADDEIEYQEKNTKLYTFRYSKDFPVAIASTRPETKFGDTAIAVHPSDERYQKYIGKSFDISFAGLPRTIRVVGEHSVEQAYGTGVLGVTPAHSALDEAIARREKLPSIQVINEHGRMTIEAGPNYADLLVRDARKKLVAELRESGLLENEVDIRHNLSVCYRCGTPVEPLPSQQWFVAVDKPTKRLNGASLKQRALAVLSDKEIAFIPDRFANVYQQWMERLHDWCISRQVWYGHRVPVWYCLHCRQAAVKPKPKARWFIVRHGQTDWNKEKMVQGKSDIPLNDTGRRQAEALGERLRGEEIDLVLSSELARARETATIVGSVTDAEVVFDAELRERNYGKAEGMDGDEAEEKYEDLNDYEGASAGNESIAETEERMWRVFSRHLKNHAHKNVVIVSHGSAIRSLMKRLRNITPDESLARAGMENASALTIDVLDPCAKCGHRLFEQDLDTLDTWFSSGLWTFSTLGWPHSAKASWGKPKKTGDLKNFYPTSVMETGYDILFFWVARMILMSTYLVGEIPFKTVYLHGLVRDKQGRKMSKSLGNGIDPLEMADKYGADAVRLALVIGTTPGNDQKLDEQKIAGYRNYVNKVWNIGRFLAMQSTAPIPSLSKEGKPVVATLADKWILNQLNQLIQQTTLRLERFEFSAAGEGIYNFIWHELADWYLEITKVEGNIALARDVFATSLKLLHPFMPFVTETLWAQGGHGKNLLMIEAWPDVDTKAINADAERDFQKVQNFIADLRRKRIENKTPAKDIIEMPIPSDKILVENTAIIERMARVKFV